MPRVLITPTALANLDAPFVQILRDGGFDLVYTAKNGVLTEDELIAELPGISATLASSERYTRKVFESAPRLRAVARVGVGYDAVDVPAATDHGVVVTVTPGSNHDAVAEHTFALILAVAKSLPFQHADLRAGRWNRIPTLPLRGRTLGLAGLGRIGKAVARRGECFGMKLLAFDPFADPAFAAAQGITLVPFDRLLAESDWLSLHLPYTAESKHLMNKTTLAGMKPGAFLINTARGGLVCEPDLIEALRSGHLGGAGLDVFEAEPPAPDNPLFTMGNVVVTPHAAGVDTQSRDDMAAQAARCVVALSRAEWPAAEVVNPLVRDRFRWDTAGQ